MKRFSAILVAAAVAIGTSSYAAAAGPAAGAVALDSSQYSAVTKVHRCHRGVREGRAGWHRHAGPNCRRIAKHHHRRHQRARGSRYWHKGARCSTYCVGVGPLRVCDRDCD